MVYLTALLIGLIVIIFIASIIWLLDDIKKITTKRTKYRIIKSYNSLSWIPNHILQKRFLWFFWIDIREFPTNHYSLEEVKSQIERFKCKNKKEVVYKE
jgi:hypothetical protein